MNNQFAGEEANPTLTGVEKKPLESKGFFIMRMEGLEPPRQRR